MWESLGVGFLGGLASGVGVYLVRQKLRADRLRMAIAMEIRKSTPVDALKAGIMGVDSLETPIIEANLDKLHLLNKEEIILVANYNNQMSKVRWYNEENGPADRVNISRRLAEETSKVANSASDRLESNVWRWTHPIQYLRDRFSEDEPLMTEEERKQKREELKRRVEEYNQRKEREEEISSEDSG